ncbi:MAG: PAS domain S-box protein [Caulobacteraceae bacterium]|nr:PAS domain S-box protein [Caulobacteraceae bacterium]
MSAAPARSSPAIGTASSTPLSEEGRLRLMIDSITDYAIYMLDPSGRVTSWNAGAQRFKGYERDEIIGEHFSRFYTEEDRLSGLPARALKSAAEQGRWESEGWRVRKDGGRFWAHVIVDAVRAPDGELIGFAKITRDLTERRQAEAAIRRTEEQFRLLVQGVTDYAIYMLDPTGRVSSWNAGAERIKGYRPDEIIGKHFSLFYAEGDREAGMPAQSLATATREGRFEKEGWRRRKDGTHFWAHVIIDAIRDDNGELLGFAKITRDITERREAQIELEKARQALFQSQKLDSIGQLTGGVAHDFNNLLMAILGSLELARKRIPDDPRVMRLLDNCEQAAQRGAALTQRMLAFARRQDLNTQTIDAPALVGGILDLLSHSVGPVATLENRLPASLPPVQTDPHQLEGALLNLVVNARDAMPEGGTVILSGAAETLSADNDLGLPPGPYVRLSVSDTGAGMDEATLNQAVEPFFTTKGVGKGTGLGLPMVHGLAEQSGGRLRLRSHVGEGTTAEIWLPVHETVASEGSPEAESPPPRPLAVARPLKILAVDDDSLVLFNTAAMLQDMGHEVIEAISGEAALAAAAQHPDLDLVISDQAMLGLTGVQLAHALRAHRPDLPFIIATGYAEMPAGIDPTLRRLAKPFTLDQLAEAVASSGAV